MRSRRVPESRFAGAEAGAGRSGESVFSTWQAARSFFCHAFRVGGVSVGGGANAFVFPLAHARLYADRSKIPAGSLDGYKAPLAIPGLFDHALSIVRTWTADLQELEALLPKLRTLPTLLMWGEKDPAVYVSSMKELARHFDDVQTVVFPGVGHLPYEECVEEFNRELMQFLKS